MENNIEKNSEEIVEEVAATSDKNPEDEAVKVTAKKPFPIWLIPVIVAVVISVAMIILLPTLLGNNNTGGGGTGDGGDVGAVTPDELDYLNYIVRVVDVLDNPVADVIVRFTAKDGTVKTRVTGQDGIAAYNNAPKGDYTVTLEKGFSTAVILQTEYAITAESNEISVVVRDENNIVAISGDEIAEGSFAYKVGVGVSKIISEKDKITYYVFTPTMNGLYQFSLAAGSSATLNYYGLSDAVQSAPDYAISADETSFRLNITHLSFSYVIGVSSDSSSADQLVIERIGDPLSELFGSVPDHTYAKVVGVGTHTVSTEEELDVYLVFTASSSGIYRLSFESDDQGMTIGYYGIPMFVQDTHRGDGEYDGKTFDMIIYDNSTPYVIGIKATKATSADVTIERLGDAPVNPNYLPWTEVNATMAGTKCDVGDKTLVDFDISDKTITVSLGSDGYYYTNDGKLVYIRITSQTGCGIIQNFEFHPVISGSLALWAGHVDEDVGVNIGGYLYDEQGNFVDKYSYNSMIGEYMNDADDEYGVVPLTEELAECIKIHGESNGWFDRNGYGYLFTDILVNAENSWLFLCMVEQ
ncbi:MAG: carboxypeptidase regulatory-like domain-containing protein [Clostridia bacterium]|nr:carboxypeptidase regulatory-like domain-containing protein [Clostridia bacterium]